MKNKRFLSVCALALIAMTYSMLQLEYLTPIVHAHTCCTYGVDCPAGGEGQTPELSCCTPRRNEADCSQDQPNYCRTTCS